MTAYRIGDPGGRFPIFSADGSRLYPGRWNTAVSPVIYTSEHYSTAMLEKLVHGSGSMPPNQHFIRITIPNGVSYEMVTPATLPRWHDRSCADSKVFGDRWQRQLRSLLLLVPSLPAREEFNILINPDHEELTRLTCSLHQPIWWDERLSGGPA